MEKLNVVIRERERERERERADTEIESSFSFSVVVITRVFPCFSFSWLRSGCETPFRSSPKMCATIFGRFHIVVTDDQLSLGVQQIYFSVFHSTPTFNAFFA